MKIESGKFKNINIDTVDDPRTRYTPATLRRALMSIFDFSGANFLEFFAGSGIMSFEVISNGAKSSTMVDISSKAVRSILKNAKSLGILDNIKVIKSDFRKSITKLSGEQFDYIFADPPFNNRYVQEFLKFIDSNAFLIRNGGYIIIEKYKDEKSDYMPKNIIIEEVRDYGDIEILICFKP
ncbi:methyltransferase [Petrotoga olearia DSM 13574]|uniref:Methyltransferase n=1 Tax=Petrotoga olearia DSM 13574 TaxID=1122955 RepID=A0A2K1NWY7_9BACT|nr:methyltransferase [Petrotoga olearia DSM 13574]